MWQSWIRTLKSNLEHDSWGHVVEAGEGYERSVPFNLCAVHETFALLSLAKDMLKFLQGATTISAQDRVPSPLFDIVA